MTRTIARTIQILVASTCVLLTACATTTAKWPMPPQNLDHSQDVDLDRRLDALVPQLLDAYAVPGAAIGIIRNGVVWRSSGYGVKEAKKGEPVTTDTAFNVGSISKPVTAWGVLRLVDAGRISLDTSVSSRLNRWSLPPSQFDSKGVTVERLLNHTAGLTMWAVPEFPPGTTVPTLEEMLNATTEGVRDIHLSHLPGSKWEYSGGGYAVLQWLIEEVSGLTFGDYMAGEVLKPLGMNASSYEWNSAVMAAVAAPHDSAGQPARGQRFTATSAAGLQTTLTDLLKFATASLPPPSGEPRRLLSNDAALKMFSTSAVASGYGLGYEVWEVDGLRFVGHGGQNEGWMAQFTLSPDTQNGLVILTNGVNGLRVISEVQCLWMLHTFARGCEGLTPLPIHVDEVQLSRFAGSYRDPSGATIDLTVHHGHIFWKTDYGYEFALRPRGGNEFGFVIGESRVIFRQTEDGTVVGLTRHRGKEQTTFQRLRQ